MELSLIVIITLLASFIGTISGFGISAIMIPFLLLFLPYSQALFFVGIIHWVNSIWKILLFRHGISWRLVVLFGLPALVMSIFGAWLVGSKRPEFTLFLGGFLIVYSLLLFIKPTFCVSSNNKMIMFGGTISGFCAGLFGMRGSIRSMFLSGLNLPKVVYIGTIGVISFAVDAMRLSIYWWQEIALESIMLWGILLCIPVSFIGAYIARLFVAYIPQEQFRVVIAFFLLLMGLRLLFLPFFSDI